MKPRTRQIILLVSCLLMCLIGVYRLLTEPVSFIPVIFALSGFVGVVGALVDVKRKNPSSD
ncbi:hypothetical protein ACQCN2_13125 [Brevibacillus ginsengisoli]|uniref:hypothetical protein n=1 Tax=Brevibacillus ginsengisoli TaxID=363854 RepID=UPI003CF1BFDC